MNTLKNRNAFSYIIICVVILVLVMFIAVAMQYAFVYHIANTQKADTQLLLDGYVTRYAIEKYDALKQGASYKAFIERESLVSGAYTLLGFNKTGGASSISYSGVKQYTMTKPIISATVDDSFGVTVKYTLIIPFEAFGNKIADITVPVEIVSKYTER